jgi:hypothetical protein
VGETHRLLHVGTGHDLPGVVMLGDRLAFRVAPEATNAYGRALPFDLR